MSTHRHRYRQQITALNGHLSCGLCGGRRPCSLLALFRYTRDGWPRCCGEVMVLTPLDSPVPGGESPPTGETPPGTAPV